MEEEGWTVVGRRGLPKGGPRRANVATAVGGSAGAGVAPALTKGGHPVNWCAKAETGPASQSDFAGSAVTTSGSAACAHSSAPPATAATKASAAACQRLFFSIAASICLILHGFERGRP
jgi:hypothetical protein